jgi:polycystin 1L2
MASWYLEHVIVHDLQTRKKFYFLCNKWLAVDKDDGRVDRLLFVANNSQKNELKYLLAKNTKSKLKDGHLWFSVLTRPVQSSFSRLERLTCCFVILYVSMLINIMYYGSSTQATKDGLDIGPFSLTIEQVY